MSSTMNLVQSGASEFQQMKRLAAEAGYNLVDGSFEEGATVSLKTQVVWQQATGKIFGWFQDAVKTVVAGSTPVTSGGVGVGAWVDRSEDGLRSDLNVVVKTFNSVANMIADDTLVVGQIIETLSYHDGWLASIDPPKGGNKYEIVASNTGVADGGSFINLLNGLQAQCLFKDKHVNVYHFGARGNGTANDSPAFQAAIAFVCGDNPGGVNLQGSYALHIPTGQFLINELVSYVETSSRKINLTLYGDGSHQSTIMVGSSNTDGFLNVGVSGGNEALFTLRDFTVIANGAGNGTAIKVFADPVGLSRNRRCIIDNISVRPNAADGQWFNRGIVANGFYYPIINNCSVSGPFGPTVSTTSYQDTSPAYFMDVAYDVTDCYDCTIQNSFAWSCKVGYDFSNTVDPGSEGGYIHHSGASRVLTGVKRHTVGREGGFIVSNCHYNFRDHALDLKNLKDVDIISTLTYNENSSEIGSGPSPVDYSFQGCQDINVTRCRFQFAGDPRRIPIRIQNSFYAGTENVYVRSKNYYIDYNNWASDGTFSSCVRIDVDSYSEGETATIRRRVLRSFTGNTYDPESISTPIIMMSSPNVPVAWLSVEDGVFQFKRTNGDNVGKMFNDGDLHIINGGVSSGQIADTGADNLVIDTTQLNSGITLLGPSTGKQRINFGDTDNNDSGKILYDHAENRMEFHVEDNAIAMAYTDSFDVRKPISVNSKNEIGQSQVKNLGASIVKTTYGVVTNINSPFTIKDRDDLLAWNKGRAGSLANLSNSKILFLGDSNTIGVGGVSTTAPFLLKYSFPSMATKLFSDRGGREGGPIGLHGWSATTYGLTDPRVSISSGWTSATESVGGHMLENSTNSLSLQFFPPEQWDTVDVWFASDSAAVANVGPNGSLQTVNITGGSIEKKTITHTGLTSAQLIIQRVSGTVRLIGYHCYNSTKGEVSFLNAGRSGWRSDHAAEASTWYSPLNAAKAISPDLCFIQFGINDWNQNINPTDGFRTAMQSLISGMKSVGSSVVLMIPFYVGGVKTYSWKSYRNEILSLAETYNCPVVDISTLLGFTPDPDNNGYVADALHLNYKGYAEVSNIVNQLLRF